MGTNTGIGIGIGIPFRNNALGGDNIYFPPELKARMIGVWDNYGKKNTDADRNIIKNKIPNAGGDLEILNAAYEGMSGCNGYPVVFGANKTWENLSSVYSYTSDVTSTTIHITRVKNAGTGLLFSYVKKDGALTNIREIPAFRVTAKGLEGNSKFGYRYLATEDATVETLVYLGNGTHELSKSFTPTEALLDLTRNAWVGIFITPMVEGEVVFDCDITIEVLPEYEGAFVTDGVNDMIISQKTIAEMGITDEVTIVSMIHQITLNSTYGNGFTNYIENLDKSTYVRNNIYKAGKTGIYGYSVSLINRTGSNINNILGDKNDYGFEVANRQNTLNASKLSIIGRATGFNEISSIAHYWTFAVLGKATADEINLIIAKYNLDRTLRPDILCNITKQGITNDNHADFNDRLIDYSGNGRDIQMYNLAWKGGSGIAAKPYETIKDYKQYEDNLYQEVIIHNEFSYTTKSKLADRYWAIQSNRKDDESLVVTIITDKDCEWICNLQLFNSEGVQEGNLKKKQNVFANTPTEVTIAGRGYFEIPEGYTAYSAASYINLPYSNGEVTVTFIPSCKGGILLDGINDFGKVIDMPIYKDYTFIIDYERISYTSPEVWTASVASKAHTVGQGAFILMLANREVELSRQSNSFGSTTTFNRDDFTRTLLYQSKYKCGDVNLTVGEGIDGDTLWLGTLRDNDYRFFNGAIYSLMSFPYSMSKFLIERQLKKHKLGTLYPNMVEFRPVIKANANYNIFYTALLPLTGDIWERINIGDYVPVGRRIAIQMSFDNEASELVSAISSQLGNISITKNSNNKGYTIFGDILKNKSPQKINITIDEYIRYEDIVQPYPVLLRFNDENGNEVSWGGKFRVGSTITRIGSFYENNLIDGLYIVRNPKLNGNNLITPTHVVEKSMVFTCDTEYLLDNNEPKCILSPSRLRMPNSSYKILGYIPDISGHGNHGKINNSAYAEGSGVNEDGSYQFDGVDDFVTIPTTVGGKQVLMKVNWQKSPALLYDQRASGSFAVLTTLEDDAVNPRIAYQARNQDGKTYIDGIENNNIETYTLKDITHNITIANSSLGGIIVPVIGCNTGKSSNFAKMSLYDFMLFDNISTDDKIKQLNEYVGIEAKVELPPYYWDAYGKTNFDVDKATIQQRGVAEGDYDITNYNHAYDKMSGYGGYEFAKFDNVLDWYLTPNNNHIDVVSRNGYEITLKNLSTSVYGWYFQNSRVIGFITRDIPFKVKANKSIRVYWDMHSYKISSGEAFGHVVSITTLNPNEDTSISLRHLTEEELVELDTNKDRMYYLLWFDLSTLAVDEEVTIEMLPLYPNGLVYDGVTDYSENANIPAFTDFTYILKRQILKGIANSAVMYKGNITVNQGGAFICNYCEPSDTNLFTDFSFGGLLRSNDIDKPIIYGTKTSVNGDSITPGENIDTVGINVGKWVNYLPMVFYKLILYPKTIPLLQINFLKNLMERDEIIDLDNPIFKK